MIICSLSTGKIGLYGSWIRSIDSTNLIKCKHLYRTFSLMWPACMQIYRKKRELLRKKRVQLPQDRFGALTWPPFNCFGTPIWPPWCHVKTLYPVKLNKLRRALNSASWEIRGWITPNLQIICKFKDLQNIFWRQKLTLKWNRVRSFSKGENTISKLTATTGFKNKLRK